MSIDTRPQIININHYAGDELVLTVMAPDYSLYQWTGQIRSDYIVPDVDAYFEISGTGTSRRVALTATDSAMLVETKGVLVVENGAQIRRYVGVYDVQAALDTSVRSLFRGSITIDSDVTRAP